MVKVKKKRVKWKNENRLKVNKKKVNKKKVNKKYVKKRRSSQSRNQPYRKSRYKKKSLPWPVHQSVAVIITAMNEEKSLPYVLKQVEQLPFSEIIIVINGSSDATLEIAKQCEKASIAYYSEALGHDVGRAVGAMMAQSDILLFLDGDIPISKEKLIPFVHAVASGVDIALNDISPFMGNFAFRDSVTLLKEFLNRSLGRHDLGFNSMTAIPHALSRRAVEHIGAKHLAVPPLAYALGLKLGLTIKHVASIDVITKNKLRKENSGVANPVERMITGDHWEALNLLFSQEGRRLGYHDGGRDYRYAKGD